MECRLGRGVGYGWYAIRSHPTRACCTLRTIALLQACWSRHLREAPVDAFDVSQPREPVERLILACGLQHQCAVGPVDDPQLGENQAVERHFVAEIGHLAESHLFDGPAKDALCGERPPVGEADAPSLPVDGDEAYDNAEHCDGDEACLQAWDEAEHKHASQPAEYPRNEHDGVLLLLVPGHLPRDEDALCLTARRYFALEGDPSTLDA